MLAVFDTNIVIDALNGVSEADTEYSIYERVIISRITWIELLVGEKQEDDGVLREFLSSQFEIAPLDEAVAEMAITLRRSSHIRLPDAIIWATAKVNGAVLVTRNTKDFKPEWEGIRVPYHI